MRGTRARRMLVTAVLIGAAALAGCAAVEATDGAGGAGDTASLVADRASGVVRGVATQASEAVGQTAEQLADPTGDAAASGEAAGDSEASPSPAATDLPRLVDDASWVRRDGESALVVTPSDLLRESRGTDVYNEAWRRVVAAVPDADTPGMRDQFVCHAMFASTKEGWYLEPRRPAVGYWSTVRAGCNPGDVTDVG